MILPVWQFCPSEPGVASHGRSKFLPESQICPMEEGKLNIKQIRSQRQFDLLGQIKQQRDLF
jgi:hypothetical protein